RRAGWTRRRRLALRLTARVGSETLFGGHTRRSGRLLCSRRHVCERDLRGAAGFFGCRAGHPRGNPKSCTEFRTNSSRDFNFTARGPSGCWFSGHSGRDLTVQESEIEPCVRLRTDVPKRCLKAREHFGTVKTHLTSLKTKFPAEQYYRFHEHWRFVLQRLVFLAAFVVYLESETLVTREAVTEILGIEPDREKGFHLDVEDYLSGVLILASELSRLSVNSVTAGDYSRPLHISTFINELDSGFRLLNLKNDSLRKRYDGLKYDVKKVEEVVYDLSIRGFNKETAAACAEK
uniref:Translin n=1 Tax=Felis catus TaxID=9685 RepID=A0ABI7WKY0_FELCA